eukprot:TRINITY_DN14238_c0_g1_i1.p1 TRINITY_DN14238_c0_g1~~TRINITY_DN14238_c0_g1_i1.p1  ORF type:complete len:802 (+),score=159.80 TRINITY_DN14238_c0_g1_i1:79-2406(+)
MGDDAESAGRPLLTGWDSPSSSRLDPAGAGGRRARNATRRIKVRPVSPPSVGLLGAAVRRKHSVTFKVGDHVQYNSFEYGWRGGAVVTQMNEDGTYDLLPPTGEHAQTLQGWREESLRPERQAARRGLPDARALVLEAPLPEGSANSAARLYAALRTQERLLQRGRLEIADVASAASLTAGGGKGSPRPVLLLPGQPSAAQKTYTYGIWNAVRLRARVRCRQPLTVASFLNTMAGRPEAPPPGLPACAALWAAALAVAAAAADPARWRGREAAAVAALGARLAVALSVPVPASHMAQSILTSGEIERSAARYAAGRLRCAPPTITISRSNARAVPAAASLSSSQSPPREPTLAEAVRGAADPATISRPSSASPRGRLRTPPRRPPSAGSSRPGDSHSPPPPKQQQPQLVLPAPQKPSVWITVHVAGFSHARPVRERDAGLEVAAERPQTAVGARPGSASTSQAATTARQRPHSAPPSRILGSEGRGSPAPPAVPVYAGLADRVHEEDPPPGAGVDCALRALALHSPRPEGRADDTPCGLMLLLHHIVENGETDRSTLRSLWADPSIQARRKSRLLRRRRRSSAAQSTAPPPLPQQQTPPPGEALAPTQSSGTDLAVLSPRSAQQAKLSVLSRGSPKQGRLCRGTTTGRFAAQHAAPCPGASGRVAGARRASAGSGGWRPRSAGGFYTHHPGDPPPAEPPRRAAGSRPAAGPRFGAGLARPVKLRAPLSPTLRLRPQGGLAQVTGPPEAPKPMSACSGLSGSVSPVTSADSLDYPG